MKKLFYLLTLLGISPTLWAQANPVGSADFSKQLLVQIFGQVDPVLTSSPPVVNALIGGLLGKFNSVVILLAGLVLAYTLFTSTLKTAHEGEALGRQWNSIWIPLRTTVGFALLLPRASGFSVIQTFAMWVVLQGITFANGLWGGAMVNLTNFFDTTSGTVSRPVAQDTSNYKSLFHMLVCLQQFNKQLGDKASGDGKTNDKSKYRLSIQKQGNKYVVKTTQGISPSIDCGTLSWSPMPSPYASINPSRDSDIQTLVNNMNGVAAQYVGGASQSEVSSSLISVISAYQIDKRQLQAQAGMAAKQQQGGKLSDKEQQLNVAISKGWIMAGGLYLMLVKQAGSGGEASSKINIPFPRGLEDDPAKNEWASMGYTPAEVGAEYVKFIKVLATGDKVYQAAIEAGFKQGPSSNPAFKSNLPFFTPIKLTANNLPIAGQYPIQGAGAFNFDIAEMFSGGISSLGDEFGFGKTFKAISKVPGLGSSLIKKAKKKIVGKIEDFIADTIFKPINDKLLGGFATSLLNPIQNLSSSGFIQTGLNFAFDNTINVGFKYITDNLNAVLTHAFKNTINSFAGTGKKRENPLIAMQKFGQEILKAVEWFWLVGTAALFAISVAMAFGSFFTEAHVAAMTVVLIWSLAFLAPLAMFLFVAGMMLAYYVPLIPFVIFSFAAIGWLVAVIEGMVAAPLVAVGLMHPGGHEMAGYARPAIWLLVDLLLRPALLIFSLMAALVLSWVAVLFVNTGFMYSINNIFSTMGPFGINVVSSLVSAIAIFILYAAIITMVIRNCFSLIHVIPMRVLGWVGGRSAMDSGASEARALEGGFKRGAGGLGKAYGSGASAAGQGTQATMNKMQEKRGQTSFSEE